MRNRGYIYDRGALSGGLVGEVQLPTLVEWGRLRDDTSEARILAGANRCSELVTRQNVGRYELVVERDGKREWEGPITYLNTQGGITEIKAKDISWYLNRTALTRKWDNSGKGNTVFVVDRIRAIIEYECQRKQQLGYRITDGMIVVESPEGARTARITLPYEKYVFEELDDLAWRNGIDYTVVRRNLILNDTDEALGEIRPMTQQDFDGDVGITTYGVELATRSIVTDGEGRAGIYEGLTGDGEHPYYGEVVLLHTEYNEGKESDEETPIPVLRSQAQRNYSGRDTPATTLRVPQNSRLSSSAAEELMPNLVPGVQTRVLYDHPNQGTISEMMRLDTMKVTETADGEDVTVALTSATGAEPIIEEE